MSDLLNPEIETLNQKAEQYRQLLSNLHNEISKVIVGQDKIIMKLIIALLSRGHVLLEGVPGLAKTLLIRTLSECIDSNFVRLQFTPDLLPADITGTKIYDHNSASFRTVQGPIFSHFVLADEINRAPPKVQSALLEAMQEKQVTIQGETFPLKEPFFVMATQNPIESEGTYRLPEAQIDRFMFKLLISYPRREEESKIIQRFTEGFDVRVQKIISVPELMEIQKFTSQVYADQKIREYVAQIVDATRHPEDYDLDIDNKVEYGASPRASLWLTAGAKSHAILNGRGYVTPEDVRDIIYDVLRHRILLTYDAEAEDITSDQIIKTIIEKIPVP
ncbi:MAG TPA: MoxR family ATPase [Candidatus Nitrosocosmicus sp.]|jgi:MoxR-like ATPase|nr:MoxR family ATPase [Candidatus Nitrosocosmicus sp.]